MFEPLVCCLKGIWLHPYVDHLRPTTDKSVNMYCYIFLPKMYWYTLVQTVVALAHKYRQTTNNVDWELTKLP